MIKILVVDDELAIRRMLQTGLKGFGYQVLSAHNGEEALQITAQYSPNLIILDLSLSAALDGLQVCKNLREWNTVPIIVLSVRDEEKIKIDALHAGADDYVTKPFSMGELEARIAAVLRRTAIGADGLSTAQVQVGALQIDLATRRVFVNGEEVHLTPKEYEVLRLLAVHRGKVITHRTLLSRVWGEEYGAMDHYVRVFINQIRKKLHEDPTHNIRYILTEPGVGYRFVDIK